MKNAHERFGWLEFDKPLKDTKTRMRVALDRFIGENSEDKEASGVAHVISVFGSDVDIGAIWAERAIRWRTLRLRPATAIVPRNTRGSFPSDTFLC